ncbi:MAG: NAD-dependent epimerase/dehydratase family protein [Candidatus Omnitrophica bacterium]|nr:NAD-dependent epimerase/dehydratase family protein [Candidatus Omnitrophota bacterium]
MKYLVTGGAGFIGSNITEELLRQGKDVRVLDDLSTGREENLAPFMGKIDFRKGDIRSEEDAREALRGIDFVLHQAALRSVAKSVERPVPTNDVNVNGTLNFLMAAKESGVRRVVYASSSSVYGDRRDYPQQESFAPQPISPYAVSKLAAEYYCRMFSKTLGLSTVSLRYFNVFGPRQNPESKYSAVIPAFIERLSNDQPCMIDGDGSQSRDFTYVSNVVDANLAACEAEGVEGEVLNVACGSDHSVNEVAEELKKIMGKDIESVHGPRRPGDVDRTFADVTRLKEKLKIRSFVGFHEGLEKTVEWFVNKHRK